MRGVLNLPNGMGAKGAKSTVYDSNNLMKALANEIKKKGGAGAPPPTVSRFGRTDGRTDGRGRVVAWSRGRVIARARARAHTRTRTHAHSLSHTHAHTRARTHARARAHASPPLIFSPHPPTPPSGQPTIEELLALLRQIVDGDYDSGEGGRGALSAG